MRSLIAHELCVVTRSAAWPVSLALHMAAATLFLAVWGPTGGVPIWSAPALAQLVAADRLLVAVLLTWLITPLFAPGPGADIVGWSAVTGAPVPRLLLSRAAAAAILAAVMIAAAVPAVVVAAEISASSRAAIANAVMEMLGFALVTVGLTAAASTGLRHPVSVWCASMALGGIAAFGTRLLPAGLTRVSICILVAVVGVAAAAGTAERRWRWISESSR